MVYYRSGSRIIRQRNWVCATNSNFLIPISLQPDSVVFLFQTYIIWYNRIHCLKYLRSTTSGCKDIRIRKLEFVTKTQFLLLNNSAKVNLMLVLQQILLDENLKFLLLIILWWGGGSLIKICEREGMQGGAPPPQYF